MSDVLLVLLEINLSSHRSIELFILTTDSQYNVLSEIIAAWDLSNDMPGMICITFVLKFQQTESFGSVCLSWTPQNPMRMRYALPQCLMEYNCSIGTEQSRIKLIELLLNSYGDKLVFLQADNHTQQVVIILCYQQRCPHPVNPRVVVT